MISVRLKLRLRPAQERLMARWLWHLTAVYNWASRTVEHDADNRIYKSNYDLEALVNGHSQRLGIQYDTIKFTIRQAHAAWKRTFQKVSRRPRLKGRRNKLNSFQFRTDHIDVRGNRVRVPSFGWLKFHNQEIPDGKIKSARVIRRASGWYLCLSINAAPRPIPVVANGEVGIDPGFSSLLTLSTGEVIEHPHELKRSARRIGQARRGRRARLVARLLEREGNQRRDRNHKLSRRLVSENALIAWPADHHAAISRRFGKSVASAAHGDLRQKLTYKSSSCGRQFVGVPSRNTTKRCSHCGALSGPSGLSRLNVRRWECSACGAVHDRDCNAAINVLIAARGARVELAGDGQTGTVL